MAELPRVMAARFVADYGLPEYDATTLTQSQAMAAYFEAVAKACGPAQTGQQLGDGEISRRMNQSAGGGGGLRPLPVSAAPAGLR